MSYDSLKPLRNILSEKGYYRMANEEMAEDYVEELRSYDFDVHVIHGVGLYGVQNIIFMREKSEYIFSVLSKEHTLLSIKLQNLDSAISKVHMLCI